MTVSGSMSPAMVQRRQAVLGTPYRLFYSDPVELVRGEGVWVWDAEGNRYLDAYNNVPCVGHSNPRVVEAMSRQAAVLNTHTRYLSRKILDYAERLLATLPGELERMMFTCSGSEANDVACRLAKVWTGHGGFIVTRNAYHGTTTATAELSPSLVAPAAGARHIELVDAPDPLGEARGEAAAFADRVAAAVDALQARGVQPAALIADTILSSDGIVPEPAGFLARPAALVRDAGGLLIADEVQAGFGRTGHMWGFARHDVVPDIVTMGKPMGNGYPVAGVAARPELVDAFGREMRYFNTFAGTPVACAAGLAVLDVIEQDRLVESARSVGRRLLERLRTLRDRKSVRDVRGAGLFVGIEMAGGDPVALTADTLVERLRHNGVLAGVTGPDRSVVKIRPPLVFSDDHADHLVESIEGALDRAR